MRQEFEKLAVLGKVNRSLIDRLLALTRTGYVMHRAWGFGRIKRVGTLSAKMIINFKGKPQHPIDLNFAAEILKPATADDEHRKDPLQVRQLNWKLLPPGELEAFEVKWS
jgi:transcription elongation factor GreA-like protein